MAGEIFDFYGSVGILEFHRAVSDDSRNTVVYKSRIKELGRKLAAVKKQAERIPKDRMHKVQQLHFAHQLEKKVGILP